MNRPWLVQRCELGGGRLVYDYMGSTEFEVGDQAKSLKRIFAAGVAMAETEVVIAGSTVKVYMLASTGFSFAEYQPYLQQMANDAIRMQESSYFDEAIKLQLGIETFFTEVRTNVWFDFRNDVLWTLTEENRKNLELALMTIQEKWAVQNSV